MCSVGMGFFEFFCQYRIPQVERGICISYSSVNIYPANITCVDRELQSQPRVLTRQQLHSVFISQAPPAYRNKFRLAIDKSIYIAYQLSANVLVKAHAKSSSSSLCFTLLSS